MPTTQKKLTTFALTSDPLKVRKPAKSKQRRLEDLKKVVSIKGGALNFDISELTAAKAILDNKHSSVPELLETLRRLSCLQITRDLLLEVPVGASIRLLKHHDNPDVARVAFTLVEKWKGLVRPPNMGENRRHK